jgi:hypothetical protein
MATTIQLKFIKADTAPSVWEPNAIYFIKNNSYAESVVTATDGTPEEMGNSQMIEEVAANAGFLTLNTLPPYPVVPADVSAFNNDAGYITAAEVPPGFSGDYNDLNNKPVIPSKTSELSNDTGFVTPSSLAAFTNKSGNITQWANNAGYITANSVDTLTNKTWQGSAITDPYIAGAATWNAKQNALGFTPENISNKDIDSAFAANSDTKYPSQKAVKTAIDLKLNKSAAAYTIRANNTGAAADVTEQVFKDIAEQVYAGTIVWGGTAPSGTGTHSYQWTQVGKLVTLRINLKYAVAGATNQTVTMTLPLDCPVPYVPNGFSGSDIALVNGLGLMAINLNPATTTIIQRAMLRSNATNTGWLIGIYSGTAVAALIAFATLQYWAA